ncbi:threonine synthase [Sulfuricurvum sp. RIFCSPLOWO2_12_FULL_43_24]|uniref:threonine synthase n=1 Tax=Sulfuricurvum sp. RIFCSPLOWO2_12_FULL_43_24 TaxID=1802247 RepID=UPI0008D4865A|nr:threonine synthase [Sulfuricurvum sp. RIFCSPLOWO2_12_FULL_43_24]OHD81314.1 MAG: threonine synthase [Sulfuricurvum sp. RIFCSPHIGHO2_02_FULL_43_9]OHD83566.1 MAG: threonine synthase [Sulfuricurvum sp. RIFCSPHIGHO2_12_FULL_44_8]OHD86730.1 MAG: threonine synthase [Sulfuricurvum sp. RIFCSPLOWO2_02_FULL_43_45]OHD89914.1 MAG: threonine synthase [Sulfuricurvum sp. RIFCSPLOWO2_12_FULL_43_24]
MKFIETRGNDGVHPQQVTFSEAILSPIASFGGLYVPSELPNLGEAFLSKHLNSSYKELAKDLLTTLAIDIEPSVIDEALSLYDKFDDPSNPVPVVKVRDDLYVSELYHGPTRAFKDMALQPFGVVLSSIAQKRGEEYLILAATSGDTGPAALETFKNRANVRVACLYPDGGTSDVQRLQMVTEDAKNLKVIGIHGDFDDAQSALKRLLGSTTFKEALKAKNISLSAANSVNFGRIIFQIIYHIHSYLELIRQNVIAMGEKVYLDVPSGNFGNALGGYYAYKMGLPVEKIIIASNENNVLTRLINTGRYDLRGEHVVATTSPAMDILISSNVERILFDLFGYGRTKELMAGLEAERFYALNDDETMKLQNFFAADYCNGAEGKGYIKEAFDTGYLMDPHTATCFKAYDCCATQPLKTIVYSTAEWTKFSPTIANALTGEKDANDIDALESISKTAKTPIPPMIKGLFDKPITQSTVIEKENIEAEILKFL